MRQVPVSFLSLSSYYHASLASAGGLRGRPADARVLGMRSARGALFGSCREIFEATSRNPGALFLHLACFRGWVAKAT